MIHRRVESFLQQRRRTLLGVGPMSRNCVDATIELANSCRIPLLMIASRRQVDSEEFGGGYVNNWTTDEYANYVIDNDKNGRILLARDHGGPWQSSQEKTDGLSLRRAMESAKASYRADLQAGFQILHIDPSVDIHGKPTVDDVLDRIYELYEFCWQEAERLGRDVIFEIGTEEQSGSTNSEEELVYTLDAMRAFCSKHRMPFPSFVVIQTGTRVMEMRNVGSFDSSMRVADELPAEIQVPKMIEVCGRYGIFMKEHNTDYLSDEALQWHPRLGIHAANVAPEFGVAESRALVAVLRENGMSALADRFLQLAFDSGRWDKWMLPGTLATDEERGLIAGHYVFASDVCVSLKKEASARLETRGIELERYLKDQVKASIMRYIRCFRMANPS